MLPTSLVLANVTAVSVTGVWLARAIAVFVNHSLVNFTAYGPRSPDDSQYYPATENSDAVAEYDWIAASSTAVARPTGEHRWATQNVPYCCRLLDG